MGSAPIRQLLPLVKPAAALTAEQVSRYSRHIIIPGFGRESQLRLANAKVAVMGAGGLGSPILLYLAAVGVGTLGIIDDDSVEVSNLQRQVAHGTGDVGRSKAQSARDAVLARNPDATIILHEFRLDSTNAIATLAGYDLVIDGSDNFATRYLLSDAAELLGIPCVWGSILRYNGQVSTFWGAPNDGGPGVVYRDLFAEPPAPGTVPGCADGGVLGVLCGTVGTLMATEAVKLIIGQGETLLGRILSYDALTARSREFALAPDPGREPVTELIDYDVFCGVGAAGGAGPSIQVLPSPRPGGVPSEGTRTEPTLEDTLLPDSTEWSAPELSDALAAREAGGELFQLIDVREAAEREAASIPGSIHLPLNDFFTGDAVQQLDQDVPIVLYCHHGSRSEYLLKALNQAGFDNVSHLTGGIDSWSLVVDPSTPRY